MRIKNRIIYSVVQALRKWGVRFDEQNDARVQAMRKEIERLNGIQFSIEQYPDGSWVAESKNIDGIITGSDSIKDLLSFQKDAIFTYFGIPPHLCNDVLLKADNEPVVVSQKVYV